MHTNALITLSLLITIFGCVCGTQANTDAVFVNNLYLNSVEECGLNSAERPVVVGVGGGSGSGKTTLANALLDVLGAENITYIPHDNYYKDLSHLSEAERDSHNFDHPDALDTPLLIYHLERLKNNERVQMPTYDFKTHCRMPTGEDVHPRRVILVEGVLIFADQKLVDEMDIKIFVDTDADIRFIRRMQRDIAERQRTAESVVEQYMTTVRPMHEMFVESSKRHADIIIPSGHNAVALDLLAHRLRSAILTEHQCRSNGGDDEASS